MKLLGLVIIVGLALWLVGGGRRRRAAAPEDDVTSPIDREALEGAERELEADREARPLHDGIDEEEADDWGPGTR